MKKVTSKIFIWIIFSMSTLGLIDVLLVQYNINDFSKYLSIMTSMIGLAGVVLYYQKIDFFRYLILIWIIVQFVEFSEYLRNNEGLLYWYSIFKSKQFFELQIGQSFNYKNQGYKLELNLVPIFYLAFYQTLKLSSYRDKLFEVTQFRENTDFEPNGFTGKIIDQFTLEKESKSFLVKLSSSITDKNQNSFNHCVISDFKSNPFGLERDLNLNLYLIADNKLNKDIRINILDLEYIDWIEGRITNPNRRCYIRQRKS